MNRRNILTCALMIIMAGLSQAEPGGGGNSGKGGGPGGKEHRSPRSQDGSYTLTISGFYKGTGTASVSAAAVSITAQVNSEGGATTTFKAENLVIAGPYFSGTGTVGETAITVKGRLDAAQASRLAATYSSEKRRGRIVGTLPSDPGDEKWKDDDKSKNDKGKEKN